MLHLSRVSLGIPLFSICCWRLLFTVCVFFPLTRLAAQSRVSASVGVHETYDDNTRQWPYLYSGATWSGRLEGGVLVWQNRSPVEKHVAAIDVPVNLRRNFEISVDVRFVEGNAESPFGLIWGSTADEKQYFTLGVTGSGSYSLKSSDGSTERVLVPPTAAPFVLRAGPNRLVVRKLRDRAACFINGRVVWTGPFERFFGARIGVRIEAGVTIEADDFKVSYLGGRDDEVLAEIADYEAAVSKPEKVFYLNAVVSYGGPPDSKLDGQQVQALFDEGLKLKAAGETAAATKKFEEVLYHRPEHDNARLMVAWHALLANDVTKARDHAELGLLFGPLNMSSYAIAAYVETATGNEAKADERLRMSFALETTGTALPLYLKDMDDLIAVGVSVDAARKLKAKMTPMYAARDRSFDAVAEQYALASAAYTKNDVAAADAAQRAASVAALKLPEPLSHLALAVHLSLGLNYYYYGADFRMAGPYLETALGLQEKYAARATPYQRLLLAQLLGEYYLRTANHDRAAELVNPAIERLRGKVPVEANLRFGELLFIATRTALGRQDLAGVRKYGGELLAFAQTGKDLLFQIQAHNLLGAGLASSRLPPDRVQSRVHLEQALVLAKQIDFVQLLPEIMGNLATAQWQAGDKVRGKRTFEELIERRILAKDVLGAEIALNNLGGLLFFDKNYAAAATYLRRTTEITEAARKEFTGEERIRFLARRVSAFQFLAECQALAGDARGLFETQSGIRARSLAENLHTDAASAPLDLASFQASLGADEAAIFYTLIGSQVVVNVVTRDQSVPLVHAAYPTFTGLKQRYLDPMNARRPGYKPVNAITEYGGHRYQNQSDRQVSAEDFERMVELTRGVIDRSVKSSAAERTAFLNAFLGGYYELLIAPLEKHLSGKKRLLLFPDNVLYFIPFEALPNPAGQRLVQRFDVRYSQSAAVRQTLQLRQYADDRKAFLGMGGALFEKTADAGIPVDSADRHVRLKVLAQSNATAGKSQREVYAAVFGPEPMTFLAGSLKEVQTLRGIFPSSDVFTGREMTENRIKQMSDAGTLGAYKVIHLATHGFSPADFPELSGVAMCILRETEGEEDGYLTAPEITRLKMKADIAVLSACETGLGRIYGGEGVAGLTGSLLLGGANRALVSLWPVSDAGTMYFMTGMYELVVQQKQSYDTAVNVMKRRFIEGAYGDDFRDVHIWAPFVHYGP